VLCPLCRFENRQSVSFCEECGATSMYSGMDMRFWLEQAEGEVKNLIQ
jgi:hypothetical protein